MGPVAKAAACEMMGNSGEGLEADQGNHLQLQHHAAVAKAR